MAIANPLRAINKVLNEVDRTNNTIRRTNYTIKDTNNNVDSLSNTLGISPSNLNSSSNNNDSTEQVLQIYETWYKSLSPSDREIVSWLVMENARNQSVTFETISNSEWFLQKPIEEQSQIGGLYFKLDEVIKATGDDKGRFLAFAFCVNGGGDNCAN